MVSTTPAPDGMISEMKKAKERSKEIGRGGGEMINGGTEVGLAYRVGKGRDISHKPCHAGDLSDVGVERIKIYNLQCTSILANSLKCLHGSHAVTPDDLYESFRVGANEVRGYATNHSSNGVSLSRSRLLLRIVKHKI